MDGRDGNRIEPAVGAGKTCQPTGTLGSMVPATSQKDKSSQSRGPRPRLVGPSAGSARDAGAEKRVPKSKRSRAKERKQGCDRERDGRGRWLCLARSKGRWLCLAHSLRCATARFTCLLLTCSWVCHILQDGQTSADLYPTIECTPRLLRVQAGTMQGAPPGVDELWQLDMLLAGERLLVD
jgi:hypothetical protein